MTRKLPVVFVALIFLAATGAASHNEGVFSSGTTDSSASITTDHIPDSSNQVAFLTQFVAPFMVMVLVLQKGMEKAFTATTDTEKDAKKYSLLISLCVTGMIVPTTLFARLMAAIRGVFGTAIILAMAAVFVVWAWIIWKVIKGGRH